MKGGGLWFFVSFRIFFSDNTRVRIFIFFVALSANFFFQNVTLGYMTKTLNQIIFFFLHQNQNIFFSNIGNRNIFLEKKHNPARAPPKIGKNVIFFGVKSWFFTRNTSKIFAPPSAIEKNVIFWRKIVIFHTKYPQQFRASLCSAQFF